MSQQPHRHRIALSRVVGIALGLAVAQTFAQPATRIGGFGETLSDADWGLLRETGRTVLNEQPDGAGLSWVNIAAGTGGTITALSTTQQGERACRQLRVEVTSPGQRESRDATLCYEAGPGWRVTSLTRPDAPNDNLAASVMSGEASQLDMPPVDAPDTCERLRQTVEASRGALQRHYAATQVYEAECVKR